MPKILFAAILGIALVVTSCTLGGPAPAEEVTKRVYRYVDYEAGVVCWVYEYSNTGGISCLPLSSTRLDP